MTMRGHPHPPRAPDWYLPTHPTGTLSRTRRVPSHAHDRNLTVHLSCTCPRTRRVPYCAPVVCEADLTPDVCEAVFAHVRCEVWKKSARSAILSA